jgi:hypothetical protein
MKTISSKNEFITRESLAKHTIQRSSAVKSKAIRDAKNGFECKVIDMGDGYFKRSISKKVGKK